MIFLLSVRERYAASGSDTFPVCSVERDGAACIRRRARRCRTAGRKTSAVSAELVMDPAFLRRIGYPIYLGPPNPQEYARIFQLYARSYKAAVPSGLIDWLLERYRAQKRELRACEPRDLIERARDICRFQGRPLELNTEVLELAWTGYFGGELPEKRESGTA